MYDYNYAEKCNVFSLFFQKIVYGGTPYEVKVFLKNSENIFGIIYKDLSYYHRCPNIWTFFETQCGLNQVETWFFTNILSTNRTVLPHTTLHLRNTIYTHIIFN